MPRRAPPTALRLVSGPTPPRSRPKHVLPSIPLPIFHASSSSVPSLHATPRKNYERRSGLTHAQLPPLDIPFSFSGSVSGSGNSSPVSASSMKGLGRIRGPWDHSGSISLDFDVESVLAPLKPVAVSPGSGSW